MTESLHTSRPSSSRLLAGATYGLLRSATTLYARADLKTQRLLEALRLAAEGVLGAALATPEKTDLTIALYGLRGVFSEAELTAWEARWYAESLPRAPARLLLAAAGYGRELGWLCEAGYAVDAFEPAAKHVAALRANAAGRPGAAVAAVQGSFDDLVAAVLHGEPNALAGFGGQSYAGVILGWGSFTHVLAATERQDLLRVCDRLAGDGPILASFWLGGGEPTRSRALQLGTSLGERLAAWRGIEASIPAGQVFRTHCGFAHEFTRDEVQALAASCGRRVVWGEYGYPHVTFVRDPGRQSA